MGCGSKDICSSCGEVVERIVTMLNFDLMNRSKIFFLIFFLGSMITLRDWSAVPGNPVRRRSLHGTARANCFGRYYLLTYLRYSAVGTRRTTVSLSIVRIGPVPR